MAVPKAIGEDSVAVASRGNSEVRRTTYREGRLLRLVRDDGQIGSGWDGRSDGGAAYASSLGVDLLRSSPLLDVPGD